MKLAIESINSVKRKWVNKVPTWWLVSHAFSTPEFFSFAHVLRSQKTRRLWGREWSHMHAATFSSLCACSVIHLQLCSVSRFHNWSIIRANNYLVLVIAWGRVKLITCVFRNLQILKTQVILILNFTRNYAITCFKITFRAKLVWLRHRVKSSAIFGKLSEIFADLPITFENVRKTSGDFRKSSGHLRKSSEVFEWTLHSSEVLGWYVLKSSE